VADCFLQQKRSVYCAVRTKTLNIIQFNPESLPTKVLVLQQNYRLQGIMIPTWGGSSSCGLGRDCQFLKKNVCYEILHRHSKSGKILQNDLHNKKYTRIL
jgi:hypothetical protein